MPEVDPQFETSFQNMIDHEYSGKDRATKDFPDGTFGIILGDTPPRWTPQQLFSELVGEYKTMVDNNRAKWDTSFDKVVGMIQNTVNIYAALAGQMKIAKLDNTTQEWKDWQARA